MRDWVTNLSTTHYLVGSAIGPHPFPTIVRDFQKIIGEEIKYQLKEARGKLPEAVVACVGGGSNAIGTFYDFIPDKSVRLIGVEAGGEGKSFASYIYMGDAEGCWQVSMVTSTVPLCRKVNQVSCTVYGHISSSRRLVRS